MGKVLCPLGHKFEISSPKEIAEKLGRRSDWSGNAGPYYGGTGIEHLAYPGKETLAENKTWRNKLRPEEGKWVNIRTLREHAQATGQLGKGRTSRFSYDFEKELYAVCPICGIMFRPKST